jgi:hypothetical protein
MKKQINEQPPIVVRGDDDDGPDHDDYSEDSNP